MNFIKKYFLLATVLCFCGSNNLCASGLIRSVYNSGGKVKSIESLISDLNIDETDTNGNTSLMISSYYGFEKLAHFLLENNANPTIKNSDNNTALILAAYTNKKELVEELLKYKKTKVNNKGYNGNTALIIAAHSKNKGVMRPC